VWETVANHYGVKQESLGVRSQHTEKRSVAAWLAKRHTQATLRELAKPLVPDQDQNWGYSRFSFVRALEVVSCPGPANSYAPFGWADLPIPPPERVVKNRWARTPPTGRFRTTGLKTHRYATPVHWPLRRSGAGVRLLGTAAGIIRPTSAIRRPHPERRCKEGASRVRGPVECRHRPRRQRRGRRPDR
jgi:hypothetical protein